MRTTTILATVVLLAALTACDPGNDSSTTTPAATTATSGSGDNKAASKTIPNFVGMGLQSAQDTAQAAGFYTLASHDALGRGRMQALDRNWKVCSQNIAAGKTADTGTRLDFGAVKLEETCPKSDQPEPTAAGAKMPDFAGKSVKAARSALDSGTSITVTDAAGDSRLIIVESNWQVCTQNPKAGTALAGQPVKFTAVKFGEFCP